MSLIVNKINMDTIIFNLNETNELKDSILVEYKKIVGEDLTGTNLVNGKVDLIKFSDGELSLKFLESVIGKRVYILSSPRTSDGILYLNLAIDSAKRGGAEHIIPIIPCFPYQRQDKIEPRGPIGSKVIVEMIEQRGATGVITFDLHADQIQGFFNIPVTHLEGKNVFSNYIKDTILCGLDEEIVLSSCDAGGVKRVKHMVTKLKEKHFIDINYVVIDKTRVKANSVESVTIIGDVKNQHVIIVDDMVDTFGSADKAIIKLIENGAKSVSMIASHGILSGPALDRIANSKLSQLIISDSVELNVSKTHSIHSKIKVISLANQIAYAIASINSKSSLEKILNNDW